MFEFICRSSLTLWISEAQEKGALEEEDDEAENLLGSNRAINLTEEDELEKKDNQNKVVEKPQVKRKLTN